jgi:hypothetical protein
VPEPSLVEVEIVIGKLKVINPQVLIKAGVKYFYSEIHKIICSTWNKEELPQQWKDSIIVPVL